MKENNFTQEDADEALQYALDALEKIDELQADVTLLRKAMELMVQGHFYGAATVLNLDLGAI